MQAILNTDGMGYWSDVAKAVAITEIQVSVFDETREFGEMRVYFDENTWDVEEDGLIYTDDLFLNMLNEHLASYGLPAVEYSEQGMQGDDYVSLDVEADFIKVWDDKFNVEEV